jgi:hypothetical protein
MFEFIGFIHYYFDVDSSRFDTICFFLLYRIFFYISAYQIIIDRSVGWTLRRLYYRLIDQSVGRPLGRSYYRTIVRSIDRSLRRQRNREDEIGWSVGQSVGWLIGRLVCWLVGWMVDCSVGWLVS